MARAVDRRRAALGLVLLVRATRLSMLAPFVVEGTLLTLGAGLLAVAVGAFLYRALAQAVQTLLPFVPVLSPEDLGRTAGLVLLLALVLGAGGAFAASRAHLREV